MIKKVTIFHLNVYVLVTFLMTLMFMATVFGDVLITTSGVQGTLSYQVNDSAVPNAVINITVSNSSSDILVFVNTSTDSFGYFYKNLGEDLNFSPNYNEMLTVNFSSGSQQWDLINFTVKGRIKTDNIENSTIRWWDIYNMTQSIWEDIFNGDSMGISAAGVGNNSEFVFWNGTITNNLSAKKIVAANISGNISCADLFGPDTDYCTDATGNVNVNNTDLILTTLNITGQLNVSGNINGTFKLGCEHIDGGTDTDFCVDVDTVGSGGINNYTDVVLVTLNITNNTIIIGELNVTRGNVTIPRLSFQETTQDKISLYGNRLDLIGMYGLGVASSTLYFKTSGTPELGYEWYSAANRDGTSFIMKLGGGGNLSVKGRGNFTRGMFINSTFNLTGGAKLNCQDIDGGSDTDFCVDGGGSDAGITENVSTLNRTIDFLNNSLNATITFNNTNLAARIQALNTSSICVNAGYANVTVTGNLSTRGFFMNNASNGYLDQCLLSSGTCTINNNKVTSSTAIFCMSQDGGSNLGGLQVTSRIVGVSYVVTSINLSQSTVVKCMLVESGG